ncbi:MAG: AgmX/PglI C-terminal domain-containing protein [Myxococcales bacterium]|nr:AgmX/PglI C-terminal domain-containing protein [Myxococcales bacterium]
MLHARKTPTSTLFAFTLAACGHARQRAASPAETASRPESQEVVIPAAATSSDHAGAPSEAEVAAPSLPPRSDPATTPDRPCARTDGSEVPCAELGPRGVSDISTTFTRARKQFKQCYEEEKKTRPTLKVKLGIKIVIEPSGAVREVSDVSTAPDPALYACVATAVRGLRFPAANSESVVQLPLSFVP